MENLPTRRKATQVQLSNGANKILYALPCLPLRIQYVTNINPHPQNSEKTDVRPIPTVPHPPPASAAAQLRPVSDLETNSTLRIH